MQPAWQGLARLTIAAGAVLAAVALLVVCRTAVTDALTWLEISAPKPGLSGLALLLLSPVAFLLLLTLVEWVLNGFGASLQTGIPDRTPTSARPDRPPNSASLEA